MQIGIGGLALLGVVATALGHRVVRRTALDVPLALVAVAFLASTLASDRPFYAPGWGRLWVVIGYFGVHWWLDDEATIARFVRTLVAAGAIAAVYGIVQHFTGIDWYRELLGRPSPVRPRVDEAGGFASVGFFRSYLTFAHVLLVPFAFALAGAGGRVARLALPAVAAALVFATARGAWLAAGGVTLLQATASARHRWTLLVLPLATAAALVASPGLRTQIGSAFTIEANVGRVAIWQANLDIVREHPVLGLGFGRYRAVAPRYYARHPAADRRSHAHNNFLQIAAEAGLVGLAAFTLLFATALRFGIDGVRRARDPERRALGAGATLAVTAFLLGGLTQYTLGDSEVATAMWAALAVAMRVRELA
jgi:O-antigen ligase